MNLSDRQLDVLQHALGADRFGRIQRYETRNFYGTAKDSPDGCVCESLCQLGLMAGRGPVEIYGGEHVYQVTDAGRSAMLAASPSPPKQTSSQKRYQQWLDSDCGWGFGDWLKAKMYAVRANK